jgi:hypothetical protein
MDYKLLLAGKHQYMHQRIVFSVGQGWTQSSLVGNVADEQHQVQYHIMKLQAAKCEPL